MTSLRKSTTTKKKPVTDTTTTLSGSGGTGGIMLLRRHRSRLLQDMTFDDGRESIIGVDAIGPSSTTTTTFSSTESSNSVSNNNNGSNGNNRNPLLPEKDSARRPFENSSILATPEIANQTGNVGSGSGSGRGSNNGGSSSSSISYFPDQVAHITYQIALRSRPTEIGNMVVSGPTGSSGNGNNNAGAVPSVNGDDGTNTNGGGSSSSSQSMSRNENDNAATTTTTMQASYLQDLTRGMDVLATRIAPDFFSPQTIVREVTTSVDTMFITACPDFVTEYDVCQDVTASIGLYLQAPAHESTSSLNGSGNSLPENTLSGPGGGSSSTILVDPATMTDELDEFQLALATAIGNGDLQDIIVGFHSEINTEPGAVVIGSQSSQEPEEQPTDKTTSSPTDGQAIATSPSPIDNESNTTPVVSPSLSPVMSPPTGLDVSTVSPTIPLPVSSRVPTALPTTFPTTDRSEETMVVGDGPDGIEGTSLEAQTSTGSGTELTTGAVVGVVLVAIVSVLAAAILVKKRRRRNNSSSSRKPMTAQTSVYSNGEEYPSPKDGSDTAGLLKPKRTVVTGTTTGEDVRETNDEYLVDVGSYENDMNPSPSTEVQYDYHVEEKKLDDIALGKDGGDDDDNDSAIEALMVATSTRNLDEAPSDSRGGDASILDEAVNNDKKPTFTVASPPAVAIVSPDEGSISAGSSGWSSSGSPSSKDTKSPGSPRHHVGGLSALDMIASGRDDTASLSDRSVPYGNETDTDPENDADDERDMSPKKSSQGGGKSIMVGTIPTPTSADTARSPLSSANSAQSSSSQPNLDRLDEAIMNGDWAAVGATAALLAATESPNKNRSSISGGKITKRRAPRRRSSNSSAGGTVLDREQSQKAAELNSLVQAQDWDALVMVAARFDAEANAIEESSRVSATSSRASSLEGSDTFDLGSHASTTGDYSSVGRSSRGGRSSIHTTGSQSERMQEIRQEVVKLVTDVVPDEIDNVDEMMTQFKGKEEELLETLRTMKERDVAKKARVESQKLARRNTKANDKKKEYTDLTAGAKDEPMLALLGTYPSPHASKSAVRPSTTTQTTSLNQSSETTGSAPSDNTTWTSNDNTSGGGSGSPQLSGSFEQATKLDSDSAAAAAAEWAIQRSLSELIEKEQNAQSSNP